MRWMTPLVVTMSFFRTILMPLTVRLSPSQPISTVLPSAVSNTDPAMKASEHWALFSRWKLTSAWWDGQICRFNSRTSLQFYTAGS